MQKFLSQNITYNDFIALNYTKSNNYVLENNLSSMNKIFNFFQGKENLLLITGFLGTGKTDIVEHTLRFINREIYSFKVYCTSATTLDDVLLMLWSKFISVATNVEISFKYVQADSFQDKVTACFSKSFSNILMTFYDFDLITEENRSDIINFITSFDDENIKTVITSKTFDTTLIDEKVQYTKIIMKALNRTIFEKYLLNNDIKPTARMVDELYKITRGYYFYTHISALILKLKELSVNDYIIAYTNSCMPFDKFLAKAYISMLSSEAFPLLNLMAMFNHHITAQVLDYFALYDENIINLLKERFIIAEKDGYYILNRFFREEIYSLLGEDTKQSLEHSLAKFYDSQLPLKPSERIMLLSRITLRNESEYFKRLSSIKPDEPEVVEVVEEDLSIEGMYKTAEIAENEFRYQDALKLYTKILEQTNDKLNVYPKLTDIYTKLGNNKFALHYADYLVDYYKRENDVDKVSIYELKRVTILYQMYKTAEAIAVLNNITLSSDNVCILIEAFTHLANIYIGVSDRYRAKENYMKAIELSQGIQSEDFSELYYKYAIILDENGDSEEALKYYGQCIESAKTMNKYVAHSYSNMGDYYLDIKEYEKSLECFEKAYSADEQNQDYYGMYYIASAIAKIQKRVGNEQAFYEYLNLAKKFAQKSNDIFAIASSSLHFGDHYSNNKQYKEALEEYFGVLVLVKDRFNQNNINKIQTRINDMKVLIGEEEFELVSRNYKV